MFVLREEKNVKHSLSLLSLLYYKKNCSDFCNRIDHSRDGSLFTQLTCKSWSLSD